MKMSAARFLPAPALPPSALTDDERWSAIQHRDQRVDGQFVYAVRSTGIYCNPSCPSRRPARHQVSFFATAADAERGGFRACKRCGPRAVNADRGARAVASARAYLEAHADERVTLADLARVCAVSAFHLQRVFKDIVGVSPRQYQDALRMGRLKARLRSGSTVSSATYDAGYGSSSRVYERAGRRFGMTPGAYRRGGAGVRIGYEIVDCAFGRLLVGISDRGVCTVALGDDDAGLEHLLRRDFPKAMIERGAPARADWVRAIVEHLGGRAPRPDVPIDVQGTAFQWQVWHALQRIPRGSTMSYRAVADVIGHPNAARAVARACAGNRLAIIVPCHRVVREDGTPGGYRWGEERKQRILAAERNRSAR